VAYALGRLRSPDTAPTNGEQLTRLADLGGTVVDQILSGRLDGPLDYRQAEDEWVLVLHGGATLDVEDERILLAAGDWILLPAGTPHRLLETQPGTSWLTVSSG
jgi:cupin 2 domain-containing protein